MLPRSFSSSSLSEEADASSSMRRVYDFNNLNPIVTISHQQPRKKRNLPGNPEPNAEVIALSPRSLLATNRFVCEVCSKGFQRDQNLQLHRRGHNLPWKLQKRNNEEYVKKVYVCPEPSCVHHSPSRALGDLTGIKKHFCRKHREKRLRCQRCSKLYAVESDYKAHSKVCGTRETTCECGRVFLRKDKYETHKPFCVALANEAGKIQTATMLSAIAPSPTFSFSNQNNNPKHNESNDLSFGNQQIIPNMNSHFLAEHLPLLLPPSPQRQLCFLQLPHLTQSAKSTTYTPASMVRQQAANVGAVSISGSAAQSQSLGLVASSTNSPSDMKEFGQVGIHQNAISNNYMGFSLDNLNTLKNTDGLTRDFLGLARDGGNDAGGHANNNYFLPFTGAVYFGAYGRNNLMSTPQGFGFGDSWLGD